ncbi:MAG: GYD domain-containing protein [Acidimicrobiia bacterium]|nr:GYD domain-containing protein [Actinomycetota bacterium]MBL6924741.1 GYD domain-containing protein [Acidimicrobiia bacterium]MBL6925787.1 GYD domain-containing protein [Acidimicrobiia bacterium]
MPKYMFNASYTTDGVQGLLSGGGSARVAAAQSAMESVGGTLEAFYFTFGENDAVIIADFPSNADAAAVSLAVSASGMVSGAMTVLLTPEEIDAAAATVSGAITYNPPGN